MREEDALGEKLVAKFLLVAAVARARIPGLVEPGVEPGAREDVRQILQVGGEEAARRRIRQAERVTPVAQPKCRQSSGEKPRSMP